MSPQAVASGEQCGFGKPAPPPPPANKDKIITEQQVSVCVFSTRPPFSLSHLSSTRALLYQTRCSIFLRIRLYTEPVLHHESTAVISATTSKCLEPTEVCVELRYF